MMNDTTFYKVLKVTVQLNFKIGIKYGPILDKPNLKTTKNIQCGLWGLKTSDNLNVKDTVMFNLAPDNTKWCTLKNNKIQREFSHVVQRCVNAPLRSVCVLSCNHRDLNHANIVSI